MAKKVIEIDCVIYRHYAQNALALAKEQGNIVIGELHAGIIKGLKSQIKPGGKRFVKIKIEF